jgi:hypothetical protein
VIQKWNQKNTKECDKRKSQISNKLYSLRDVKPTQNAAEVNRPQHAKSQERSEWRDKIPAVVKVVLKMSCSTSSGEGKVVHASVHYTHCS